MVFMCCHPSLPPDARVALSLKTVGGFSVRGDRARIPLARNRRSRSGSFAPSACCAISDVGLELPHGSDLGARTESVLEVIYLLFNEGYNAHAGEDLIRQDLCGEALRLGTPGRAVAAHASPPMLQRRPAAHALVALMAFQAARLPARVDGNGEMVLLEDQDRVAAGIGRWSRSDSRTSSGAPKVHR